MGKRLELGCANFAQCSKKHCLHNSQPLFTIGRLGLASLQSSPTFKGKAHNTVIVAYWVTGDRCDHLSRRALAGRFVLHDRRHHVVGLWGYCEMMSIFHRNPQWLDDSQLSALADARTAALHCNAMLSSAALEAGRAIWPMKPKHHLLDHMVREALASRQNPCWCWTFCDEDFIGCIHRLAVKSHRTTLSQRAGDI